MSACAEVLHASCLCGGVCFEVTAPPLGMGNCHCSMCRRAHGSAFSTYAQVATNAVRVTRGEDLIETYASSANVERRFCARCGSKLFYANLAMPQLLWVAAGAFDDDPGIRSDHHIFVAAKAPWYEIGDDLPQHAGFAVGHEH